MLVGRAAFAPVIFSHCEGIGAKQSANKGVCFLRIWIGVKVDSDRGNETERRQLDAYPAQIMPLYR